jgi:signal transduction histidine kinase
VLLTALAASLMLPRAPALASFLRARCSPSTRASLGQMRDYVSSVMAEFEGRGMFLTRARSVFSALRRHVALFALVGLLLVVLRRLQVTGALEVAGYSILLPVLALAVSLLMLLPALRDLWQELCLLADALAEVLIRRHRQDEQGGRQMARDFLILLGLLVLMVLHPIAVDVLLLPDFVHLGVLLPLGGMALVVLHMFGILRRSFHSRSAAEGAL